MPELILRIALHSAPTRPGFREKDMEESHSSEPDKMSDLARELEAIERREDGVMDSAGANEAREALISAMRGVFKSHYDFAEKLDRYRKLIRPSTSGLSPLRALRPCRVAAPVPSIACCAIMTMRGSCRWSSWT